MVQGQLSEIKVRTRDKQVLNNNKIKKLRYPIISNHGMVHIVYVMSSHVIRSRSRFEIEV
jgi:hypothetical protein